MLNAIKTSALLNSKARLAKACLAALLAIAVVPDQAYGKSSRRGHGKPRPQNQQVQPQRQASQEQEASQSAWPRFSRSLSSGQCEVRIVNPNAVAVKVGVRSGSSSGRDITIPAGGTSSMFVPDGSYRIYFQYANERDALYEGDSFRLSGNGIEIRLVRVANGNYGLRRVN